MTLPLHPTKTWPSHSHRLSRSICLGETDCQYEPKLREQRSRGVTAGCNIAWSAYSETHFKAFQEANPDLQYKDHHPCILEAQSRNHRCPRPNCGRVRGRPLDHDELVRFPDNEKIIISHPYPGGEDHEQVLESWRRHKPEITMVIGGTERSWYFPGASSLVIVGQQQILERINLEYELPEGAEPSGCVRWPG